MKLCVKCNSNTSLITKYGKYESYCKECKSIVKKEWYQKNKESEIAKAKEYHHATYKEKREHKIQKATEWVKNNPEQYKVNAKKCYENTKSRKMAYAGMKRALLRNAVPSWFDSVRQSIDGIYAMRDWMNLTMFGIKYEVDHIIPLTNKFVCGLHVPNNLQIITQYNNRSKQNKFKE
jgi:hypothetical protein